MADSPLGWALPWARFASFALVASLGTAACSADITSTASDVEEGDGGGGGTGGEGGGPGGSGGVPACDAPDTTCPTTMPHPGGPCQGPLSCHYEDGLPWNFQCTGGEWAGQADCSDLIGGSCPVQEPSESCDGPFVGQIDGASVALGPDGDGAFRSFEDGEAVEVVWGGQGSAMVFYRIRVDGDDIPACVVVTTTVAAPGAQTDTQKRVTRLRCGDSLGMYLIVPFGDCGASAPVPTTITVEVEGIGSTDVTVDVPAEAFCPAFG